MTRGEFYRKHKRLIAALHSWRFKKVHSLWFVQKSWDVWVMLAFVDARPLRVGGPGIGRTRSYCHESSVLEVLHALAQRQV